MSFVNTGLPFVSFVISIVFAFFVLKRYLERKGLHLLLWGIGMVFYGIGGFCEAYYGVFGWNPLVFRLWYLFGAILVAAWLGQGTVYLLAKSKLAHVTMLILTLGYLGLAIRDFVRFRVRHPFGAILFAAGLALVTIYLLAKRKRAAHFTMAILALGSLYGAIRVFAAQLDPSLMTASLHTGSELSGHAIVTSGVRDLTPIFNLYGTVTLVGGAAWSAWLFFRKRILLHRTIGNVLIAVGAMLPAFGGTFSRLGVPSALYIGELLGAVLMFLGFLRATTPMTSAARAVEQVTSA